MGYVPPAIETGAKTGFIFTINSRWSCFFERNLWNVRNQQFQCFQFGYSRFPSLERRGFPHASLAFKWLMKQSRTDFSLDAGQLDIGNSGKALWIINQYIHQRIIFLPGKMTLHGTYRFFHPQNGGNHQWSETPQASFFSFNSLNIKIAFWDVLPWKLTNDWLENPPLNLVKVFGNLSITRSFRYLKWRYGTL